MFKHVLVLRFFFGGDFDVEQSELACNGDVAVVVVGIDVDTLVLR